MKPRIKSVSLLWRILFSTSIAITVLFAGMGWFVQNQFANVATQSLEQEVRASFQAYDSLWRARADRLSAVSLVLSQMPQVRSAFGTRDRATILDTAAEAWEGIKRPGALFVVADPDGAVISTVGSETEAALTDAVRGATRNFPRQASGFVLAGGHLYQIVVTPVYVAGGLLNVMVAGVAVDSELASELKTSTGGSDFVFLAHDMVAASTLDSAALHDIASGKISGTPERQIDLAGAKYYQFASTLSDVEGHPVGELRILRSFEAADNRISQMRRRLVVFWIAAMLAGFALTYLLARRLLKPVAALGRAAAEIGKGNYDVQVSVQGRDEIGRLAATFNDMCASIRHGREDLIRQERISTIGRLSTSIVHDLRNPLAAIYGGAEMLVDADLSPEQIRRLAANIYRSSRQVQDLLQELADVSQGRAHAREICRLREVILAAYEPLKTEAETQHVSVDIKVPDDIDLPLDRSPMERVFLNLISNAIEAMPEGGSVRVRAERRSSEVLISVEDTGPGIPAMIAAQLFQPFVTAGKKNGMGLGLALSRKTVLSHGGDLWSEGNHGGAKFVMKLPV